jgi:hypothetical protein
MPGRSGRELGGVDVVGVGEGGDGLEVDDGVGAAAGGAAHVEDGVLAFLAKNTPPPVRMDHLAEGL